MRISMIGNIGGTWPGMRCLALAGAWAALPSIASAGDLIPPKVEATTPGGMNIMDGSFNYHVTDLALGPLTLERFLQPAQPSAASAINFPFFGPGMTSNFDIYVATNFTKPVPAPWNIPSEFHPIVHIGASASGMFLQANPRGTVSELNLDSRAGVLTYASSTYTYSDSNGVVYTFNPSVSAGGTSGNALGPSQRVASISYPDGRVQTFTYFAYGGNNHLKMISDSSGYAIIFDYYMDGNPDHDGNVSAACAFDLSHDYVTSSSTCAGAALKVSYGYGSGWLTSSTDVFGQVTTYSGVGPGGIGCIKPPGYSVCKVQAGGAGGILFADGSSYSVVTDAVINMNDPEASGATGSTSQLTDPNGKVSRWVFDKGTPLSVTDANGHVTTYQFTGGAIEEPWYSATQDGTMLVSATMPEGNKYLAEYHGPFNSVTKQTWQAKPGSALADQVIQFSYATGLCAPQGCAKVATKTDAKGNVTNNDYYSWGGIKSEMAPSPVPPALWTGSTPASDKVRPLKLYDYVQKYPYIKNSAGTLVAGPNQIWVANSETDCQTVSGSSTAACDTSQPITVTTYEYGAAGTADTLLLRGKVVTTNTPSGAPTLRTCYGYDAQGRKIWETSPRGTTSASCS